MLDSVDMWFLLMANTVTAALVIACLIIFAAIVCPAAPCKFLFRIWKLDEDCKCKPSFVYYADY